MKELSLRPYPGRCVIAKTRREFADEHARWFGERLDVPGTARGRTAYGFAKPDGMRTFVVYAADKATLTHELAHVILDTFAYIDSDPREGNGEPFCYLLGQLFAEATASH